MRFIFFSKTMYSETPRIRHQLSNLLISYGHEVIFYQKPLFFFHRNKNLINEKVSDRLEIRQTKQLLHHQLRLFGWGKYLNSTYETKQIKLSLKSIKDNDVIINFNYDYFFLRNIFKKNKIITIINDDFVAQANFNHGRHVIDSLLEVSKFSNSVLAVSYPLLAQVQQYTNRAQLFLPWAENSYSKPIINKKDSILIWASINTIIDFDIVKNISIKFPQYKIYLIGPMHERVKEIIDILLESQLNIFYLKPKNLNELNDIGNFFVGLMPYKSGVKSTEAVTAANKTFRLMSIGLPLIVHGMPNFYQHETIFKCNNLDEIIKSIDFCYTNFDKMQTSIKELVNEQQPAQRYTQILSIINEE